MRILVTFAVEAEFAPWRKRHDFHEIPTSPCENGFLTRINGIDVIVGLTGIGPAAAASKICDFTWGEQLDLCISSGFAGALRHEHSVGDLLAAKEILPDRPRALPDGRKVVSSKRLLQIAEACGAKVVDRFYSSPSTIRTATEKASLRELGDAVEMESFEVMSEALAWVPEAIAIRAISDSAVEDLPLDFAAVVTEQGQLSMTRLAGELIRKPTAIPGLVRLGRKSAEAAKRLADFLDSYIPAVAHSSRLKTALANLT